MRKAVGPAEQPWRGKNREEETKRLLRVVGGADPPGRGVHVSVFSLIPTLTAYKAMSHLQASRPGVTPKAADAHWVSNRTTPPGLFLISSI